MSHPRAGKSRLGDEVHGIMQQASLPLIPKEARITITRAFSNGTRLSAFPVQPELGEQFCTAILIRSALLPEEEEHRLVPVLEQIGISSMKDVGRHRPPNTPVAITLVFDELQEVLARGVHAIHTFTTCFAQMQLAFERPTAERGGLFVTVLFIGTSDKHIVRDSTWPQIRLLPLPLLSQADSERLAEVALNGGQPIAWAEYPLLRHALWLCGGWPRTLQFLLNETLELHEPLESLKEFREFDYVTARFVALWTERYGLAALPPEFLQYLMAAAVLRPQLRPAMALPMPLPGVATLYDAAACGYCVLIAPDVRCCAKRRLTERSRAAPPCDACLCHHLHLPTGLEASVQLPTRLFESSTACTSPSPPCGRH